MRILLAEDEKRMAAALAALLKQEKHGGTITAACRDGKVIFTVSIPEKNK